MMNQQTGQAQIRDYSQALSQRLLHTAEQSGLDTAETEALIQWASTETANHSLNILEQRRILMNGSKGYASTMNRPEFADKILVAVLQAMPGVRYAAIVKRPREPDKAIAYLGRYPG